MALITIQEVQQHYEVPARVAVACRRDSAWVIRRAEDGTLDALNILGRWFISKASVEKFLSEQGR